jgi:hypothetical protein
MNPLHSTRLSACAVGKALPVLILMLAVAPAMVSAQPQDMSVQAFENFKTSVETEIQRQLSEEFREREEGLEQLQRPFEVGTDVTIELHQGKGTRVRQVTGRFEGINRGRYAAIGRHQYLKDDIRELDWQRLYYGQYRGRLQVEVNNLKLALSEDKAKRGAVLREVLYREAGYTDSFFESVIAINGSYWNEQALGHRTIEMEVDISPKHDLVKFTFQNQSGGSLPAFVVLYGSLPLAFSADFPGRANWKSGSFNIHKSTFGETPFASIGEKTRLWLLNKRLGSLQLTTAASNLPSTVSANEAPCPECQGKTRSFNEIVLPDGQTQAQPITCPTCAGRGSLPTDPYQIENLRYTYSLSRNSVRRYSRELEAQFAKAVQMGRDNQAASIAKLDSVRAAARKERQEREAANAAAEEAARQDREARLAIAKQFEVFNRSFSWQNAATKTDRELKEGDIYAPNDYDSLSFPTRIDGNDVIAFSRWVGATNRDVNSRFQSYRVIKLSKVKLATVAQAAGIVPEPTTNWDRYVDPGDVQYFLQFRLSAHDTPKGKFTATVRCEFESGVEEWTQEFSVPPAFSGHTMLGLRELDLGKNSGKITKVEISGSAPAGSEGTDAGKIEIDIFGGSGDDDGDESAPTRPKPRKKKPNLFN